MATNNITQAPLTTQDIIFPPRKLSVTIKDDSASTHIRRLDVVYLVHAQLMACRSAEQMTGIICLATAMGLEVEL